MIAPATIPGDIVPRRIGIVGFDGVATLDFIGPLEAFRGARTFDNYHRTHPCYEVLVLGLTRTFVSESGVIFKADRTLESACGLDTIVLPGGSGCRSEKVSTAFGGLVVQGERSRAACRLRFHRTLSAGAKWAARSPLGHDTLASHGGCDAAFPDVEGEAHRVVFEGRAVYVPALQSTGVELPAAL